MNVRIYVHNTINSTGDAYWGGRSAVQVMKGCDECYNSRASMGGGFFSPASPSQGYLNDNCETDALSTVDIQATTGAENASPRLRSSQAARMRHAQEKRETKNTIKRRSRAENIKIEIVLSKPDHLTYTEDSTAKYEKPGFNFTATTPPSFLGSDDDMAPTERYKNIHPPEEPTPSSSVTSSSIRNRNKQNTTLSSDYKLAHEERQASPKHDTSKEEIQQQGHQKLILDVSFPVVNSFSASSESSSSLTKCSDGQGGRRAFQRSTPHHAATNNSYHCLRDDKSVELRKKTKYLGADENFVNNVGHSVHLNKDNHDSFEEGESRQSQIRNNPPIAKYPQLSLTGDKKILSTSHTLTMSQSSPVQNRVSSILEFEKKEENFLSPRKPGSDDKSYYTEMTLENLMPTPMANEIKPSLKDFHILTAQNADTSQNLGSA